MAESHVSGQGEPLAILLLRVRQGGPRLPSQARRQGQFNNLPTHI